MVNIVSGSETRVNTYTDGYQYSQQITALPDGGWVVTWLSDGQDGSGSGVYQQAYDADGIAVGTEARVNTHVAGDQLYPQITALSGGGWVVTWHSYGQDGSDLGVYQQAYDADGIAVGGETQVNTYTNGTQHSPQITALSDGGWVVTWHSYGQDGSSWGVYQQAYDAGGIAVGGETQVNTYTDSYQESPRITALSDGGWVVTWHSFGQDGSAYGVYQQAYDADGVAVGGETQVNTYMDSSQIDPQITALPDGGWVVTWESHGQDGSYSGVYQQAYDADGVAVGGETQVNTYTNNSQTSPQITALSDGGWVVTWMSDFQDVSSWGVYQQAYDADGIAVGGETQVNTYTDSYQESPRITALSDGGWVVTWHSYGQDGSDWGVYQQAYDADGVAVGGETQVNTYMDSSQIDPQITALSDGGWVVTWESYLQDGSSYGVYQKTFRLNHDPSGSQAALSAGAEDAAYTVTRAQLLANYTDSDGDTLDISGLSVSNGATVTDLGGGTWRITPAANFNGTLTLSFTVEDGFGGSVAGTQSITFAAVNYAPTVTTPVPAQTVVQGVSFQFQLPDGTFLDADGDSLAYVATLANGTALPAWLSFDAATGGFSGTPGADAPGTVDIRITATDPSGETATTSFSLGVNAATPPEDIALSVAAVGKKAAAGTVVGAISGTDADIAFGDSLTFELLKSAGGRFAISGGNLTVAQGASFTADSYSVTIRVTDQAGLTFDKTFTIGVGQTLTPIDGGVDGDSLVGSAFKDILRGFAGDDVLEGGAGADTLIGGAGSDTASYASATRGVIASLGAPNKNTGDAKGDIYKSIENLTGSAFNDTLAGNNKANVIDGGAGNDILTGGGGRDIFVFGAGYGRDTITDFATRGPASDLIDLSGAVGIEGWTDLVDNHMIQKEKNTVITADDGSVLVLKGVDLADLAEADFLF